MVATERLGRVTGQVEASEQKSAFGRASDLAGRNASEALAGLESEVVDADPPVKRGRPRGQGKNRHAPVRSAGVVSTACKEGDLGNWETRCRWRKPFNIIYRMVADPGVGEGRMTYEAG